MNMIHFRIAAGRALALVITGLLTTPLLADTAGEQAKLAAANNAFAFDLMGQVAKTQPGANVFLSPFSVSSALQMTANGAAGKTKAEMQHALSLDGLPAGSLNAAFKGLNQQLTTHKDVTLTLANGLWVQNDFRLKPAFVSANHKFFQAELANVNFGDPQAAQAINDWADHQTQGKIKQVVQFPFPPLTRLVLANAIYFKGQWVKPFEKQGTRPRDFHQANGQSKQAPMMNQDGHFAYQATAKFQAVKLPYLGGLEMQLFLPATNSSPAQLLAELTAKGAWPDVQNGFAQHEGAVTLPKFKLEFDVLLNDALKTLGMQSAFASDADFSNLANEPLYISQVKQKSYVDVNEQGTEAAAVTTVTMTAMAIMRPPADRFEMVLDRPFFFVISETASGSILFTGIVNDPVAAK